MRSLSRSPSQRSPVTLTLRKTDLTKLPYTWSQPRREEQSVLHAPVRHADLTSI